MLENIYIRKGVLDNILRVVDDPAKKKPFRKLGIRHFLFKFVVIGINNDVVFIGENSHLKRSFGEHFKSCRQSC